MNSKLKWWQTGIIYQIYPRSFMDGNGDGVGDLRGIIQKLDYLKNSGVDAIWLSPIYPSPMKDFGYDISDYRGIEPIFGTMDDFDELLAEIHDRGMKMILDLVPNHTSDQHPFFLESRISKDNPKRDWYLWRDPAPDGGPPNNWLSFFGGSAWTFDEATGQYYLTSFAREQCDLNFRNPDVLPWTLDNMRFWLDRGVDGFRVDVIWTMLKDEQFRDEPPNPDWDGNVPHDSLLHIYTQDVDGIHDIVRTMRAVIDEYDDRVMIGEIYLPPEKLVTYYGENLDECHMPYNFELIIMPEWSAKAVHQAVDRYHSVVPDGAQPNYVLGNHDQHRLASRVGRAQAQIGLMLLLTLRGTPTFYYGEEINMVNGEIPPEKVHDPAALYQMDVADVTGRDPERTPMQWDTSENAGFSPAGVETWLPVTADYKNFNVAVEDEDKASTLSFFRRLVDLRRQEPALHGGKYQSVDTGTEDIFAYLRTAEGEDSFLVVLNFTQNEHTLDLSSIAQKAAIAHATDMIRAGDVDLETLVVNADEGLVLRLS